MGLDALKVAALVGDRLTKGSHGAGVKAGGAAEVTADVLKRAESTLAARSGANRAGNACCAAFDEAALAGEDRAVVGRRAAGDRVGRVRAGWLRRVLELKSISKERRKTLTYSTDDRRVDRRSDGDSENVCGDTDSGQAKSISNVCDKAWLGDDAGTQGNEVVGLKGTGGLTDADAVGGSAADMPSKTHAPVATTPRTTMLGTLTQTPAVARTNRERSSTSDVGALAATTERAPIMAVAKAKKRMLASVWWVERRRKKVRKGWLMREENERDTAPFYSPWGRGEDPQK